MIILDENLPDSQRQLCFDTKNKRMGTVIRVAHKGLVVWKLHAEEAVQFGWAE